MKTTTILLLTTLFLASCQRQPTANFTTDKTEYLAGDTVHLKNMSVYGKHFIWTMPDGSTQTTTDATYIIPDTTLYSNFTFKLEALSIREKKSDEKNVTVLATIKPKLALKSISIGNSIYSPSYASRGSISTSIYSIYSTIKFGIYGGGVSIYFAGSYQNMKPGVYELQPTYNNLASNQACLLCGTGCADCLPQGSQDHKYSIISGKIVVKIEYLDASHLELKTNIIYNDLLTFKDNTNEIVKISGNIITQY